MQLAEKVVEVVGPLREKLDAVLIFPSMPDVMRLNKVRGKFLTARFFFFVIFLRAGWFLHNGANGSV